MNSGKVAGISPDDGKSIIEALEGKFKLKITKKGKPLL